MLLILNNRSEVFRASSCCPRPDGRLRGPRPAADRLPVVTFSETLPEGKSYLQWMTDNVENVAKALA
jgi:hypothetical protein